MLKCNSGFSDTAFPDYDFIVDTGNRDRGRAVETETEGKRVKERGGRKRDRGEVERER